jgi:hypothetical protein
MIHLILDYVTKGLALVGFFTLIAAASYLYHSDRPTKQVRAGVCINSSCEDCPVKPTRFKRHQGVCNE